MPKRSSKKVELRRPAFFSARLIVLAAVIVVVMAVWLFGHEVYDNTNNVFFGMISNSLYTPGYITQITKSANDQESNEYVLVQTGAQNITRAINKVSLADNSGYKIVTESIGTPVYDYVRYLNITSPVKGKSGKLLNYNSVLGTWGINPADPKVTDGQLFNETVLGVIPIGLVSQAQHDQLMKYIKDHQVYKLASQVERQTRGGRLEYVYKVNVDSVAYLSMVKQFGTDLGLNQLSSLTNGAIGSSLPQLQITVDTLSRQLVSIGSVGSATQENYFSYGIRSSVNAPNNAIPISSLEAKLEAIH